MKSFGTTTFGFEIPAYTFGKPGKSVLILGGVHGDETEGTLAALELLRRFQKAYSYSFETTLVPAFNLDGVTLKTRTNGNSVDLNRNLPTKDWNPEQFNPRYPPGKHACSEPENKALVAWLDQHKPAFVFSLHSYTKPMLNTNGDCARVAEAMHAVCKLPIEPTIGYPTPGCLGTYSGIERGWPTITYELLKGDEPKNILTTHVDAILIGMDVIEEELKKR